MNLKNPFADYGGIVEGERFIGRQKEIEAIKNRLLGSSFGNIAIIGLPRIGKSSLAWNTIFSEKHNLVKKKILPIWIAFGEYESIYDTFEDIIFEIENELSNSPDILLMLSTVKEKIVNSKSKLEKRRFIKRYFKTLKSKEYRIIVVFDEFDNAKNIMNLQDFQFLRELSYNVQTKIGLLTISRKTIQELEPDNGILSNFYQIFTDLRLKLFSEDDLYNYWKRIEKFKVEIKTKYKNEVVLFCGNHPFLLDVLNHEVFNQINQYDSNLESTFLNIVSDLKLKLYNEYESILKLMSTEDLGGKLMQAVVGPVYDINQRDIEKLLKYDIIKLLENGNYSSFSNFFNEYLSLKSYELDIWPLWSEVEIEVRAVIKIYLNEKFGENWEVAYAKQHKQKKGAEFINGLNEIKAKNKSSFGDKASNHLVDYTYPMDMFDRFIAADWSWFSKIFEKQKGDWKPIFQHLGKIRNPLAHNNPNFLSDSDKNLAEGYSKVIIEKINNWKSIP